MPNIASPPGGNPMPDRHASRMTALALIFRIVRWTVYACALIVLILLLHKSAPPIVSSTPEAAARVEQKFQDAQQAVAQGQPATLRMDETELNSYLASHFVLPGGQASNPPAKAVPGNTTGGAPNAEQPTMMMSSRCART